ncbi:hypothetical protein [Roseivirga seohaensis]|uniref:hypothetical protein n=1 Tax=Roseivirga seohaensis TaxID=1914963 RepID=UPI00159EC486|nr:hypothetical protein [Roseivirga seohaensis]
MKRSVKVLILKPLLIISANKLALATASELISCSIENTECQEQLSVLPTDQH